MVPKGDLLAQTEEPERSEEEEDAKSRALIAAFGEYFGVDPDTITGYAAVIERIADDKLALSSVWSQVSPPWRLEGFVRHLLRLVTR